jgi:hypothetical protein
MARKRDIVTRVGADTSEHDAKLGRSAEVVDKFGQVGAAAGKLVAAGMVAAAAAVATLTARGIELGDALDDAASGLGLTVDRLASLRFAAKFANVDSEQLDASLAKLARTTSLAAEGNKAAAEAFDRLGLSGAELRKLPLDEQFERVADAMQGLTNDTDKARIAQDIFGRSGAKLLPLLNQGAAAIRAQREEARALGLTLDETQRKNIVGASDAMDKLKAAVDGASLQFAAAFGPAIEAAAGAITRLTQVVVEALPRLQALAERFFGIAAAAQDLSDAALQETLVEQIRLLDDVNERVALLNELQRIKGNENSPSIQFQVNEALAEQAEVQGRINELLAERVVRIREAEKLAAAGTVVPGGEDDEPLTNNDQAQKDAQAELDLVTAVAEERERVHQLELEQEAEWRQAMFEAREEFAQQEIDAERELVDALLIETQRYAEEVARIDADALKRKRQVRKDTVDNAFAGFTQITAALAAHNEKAFKLNKVAAKAEAGLNAFRAIQQVWADNSLPFYAKIAATAITAVATAANIAAINKSEFGGGAVPSNLGATPVTPAGGALPDTTGGQRGAQTIFVQGLDAGAIFSGDAVRGLLERLQSALDDGGKLVIE